MPTRPLKLLVLSSEKPNIIMYNNDFSEKFEHVTLISQRKKKTEEPLRNEKNPGLCYLEPLPLKAAKVKDLKVLSKFCKNPAAREFYSSLVGIEMVIKSF